MEHLHQLDKILNKLGANEFEKITPLKKIADKTGVKVSYLVSGAMTILFILMIASIGATILSGLVGFVYPAQ